MSGGFNPSPSVYGGAANLNLEAIQEGVAAASGTALASERGTLAWVENHATARVLWDLYRLPERLAAQWDPVRMTELLPRWEKILRLSPFSYESLFERRVNVQRKMALAGVGTTTDVLTDYIRETLGPMFVGIEYGNPMTAITYIPGGESIPGGPTLLDGDTLGPDLSPWTTTLGYIAIKIHRPVNMTLSEFYDRAARLYDDIDNLIGAWMDFDWINDGPNGAGFYLDDENNLDNQRFD